MWHNPAAHVKTEQSPLDPVFVCLESAPSSLPLSLVKEGVGALTTACFVPGHHRRFCANLGREEGMEPGCCHTRPSSSPP